MPVIDITCATCVINHIYGEAILSLILIVN